VTAGSHAEVVETWSSSLHSLLPCRRWRREMRSEGGSDDFSLGFLFVLLFAFSYVISLVHFLPLRDRPGWNAGEATTGRSRAGYS